MYYQLGRAGRALDRFGVIEFATTLAPGVRDVLLTGKVYEAAKERPPRRSARQYDAVVLDAPPTGRIAQFLGVNSELAGLAKVGPIKTQADQVMKLFRSPRTAIHLVTVLEEMPVQETADGIEELRAAGLPVGAVVVNLVRPRDLGADAARGRARRATLDRGDGSRPTCKAAGIEADDEPGRRAAGRGPRPRRTSRAGGLPARRSSPALDVPVLRAAPAARRRRPRCALRVRRAPQGTGPRMSRRPHDEPQDPRPLRPAGRRAGVDGDAARRRRPPRRPRYRDHRLLRLRRRRQDHDLGGPRAARRRAWPPRRGADHRPGPPARAGDGDRGARQHPAAGHRRRDCGCHGRAAAPSTR